MVLGSPQHVKAELIHQLGNLARSVESVAQALVRIAPLVRRCPFQADVFELDLTDIQNMEFFDHAAPRRSADRMTVTLKDAQAQVSRGRGRTQSAKQHSKDVRPAAWPRRVQSCCSTPSIMRRQASSSSSANSSFRRFSLLPKPVAFSSDNASSVD